MKRADPPVDIDASRVRAVVFDLGGVLIEGGPREVAAFGARVGLDAHHWDAIRRDLFGNYGSWAALERGEVTFDSFVEELEDRVRSAGGSLDRETAISFMGDAEPMSAPSRVRTAMVELVRDLKKRVATALLTNNVREWRSGWSHLFDDPSLFDVVVDSSEVGSRKPETRIYEVTRERLGIPHGSVFFVDDIGQNLKAARALGWQTFLFTEENSALPVLRSLQASL